MATLSTNVLTLSDWAKRLDPDGSVSVIVEMLSTTNEILTDMLWIEGNLPTGHRTTVRTGLPSVAWRLLNYGVQTSKSSTQQVDDATGMLEAYSEVDKDLATLNGNLGSFRLSESRAFIEAMNQEFANVLFYGDTGATPNKFLGLTPRYNALSGSNSAVNIIDGGGAGGQTDLTSIWLVVWGDQTVHGIFPKGSTAGLQHEDLGIDTVLDSQTPPGRFQAYRDHYQWKCGMTVRDWRYVVRICNIDVSNLIAQSGMADLIIVMIRAMNRIPHKGMGRSVFYCNRTILTYLQIQALAKSNSALAVVPAATQFTTTFFGVPIRLCDAIRNDETRVV